MQTATYLATSNAAGTIRVLRTGAASLASGDAALFPMQIASRSSEAAQQLAWLLLYDCLGNDHRADRLRAPFTDLLVGPLLAREQWMLTCEEIEAAVEAIELREGWLWLDAGCYHDEDPLVGQTDANHDEKDQYFNLADGNGNSWLKHKYEYVRRQTR